MNDEDLKKIVEDALTAPTTPEWEESKKRLWKNRKKNYEEVLKELKK
jgi:hypothetical protein